jgi:hypothetical protein
MSSNQAKHSGQPAQGLSNPFRKAADGLTGAVRKQ